VSWKAALFDGTDVYETCIMCKGENTCRRDVSKGNEVESADVYTHCKV